VTTIRIGQKSPHLQFDGTQKHSVYATECGRTKPGRVIAVRVTLVGRLLASVRCMPGGQVLPLCRKTKGPG